MRRLFHKTPIWIQKLYPDFEWKIETSKKEIFLTFDDGPIPEITEFVLDELKRVEARSTFFCVGENLDRHPELAKRIVAEGHVIGNHTYNHLKGWQTKNFTYWRNVLKCEASINKFQKSARIFRPPYGRIKRSQAKALNGFRILMWNRLSWDFERNLNTEKAFSFLTDAPSGSIFVFHDNAKSFKNLKELLPSVIDHYHKKGFDFRTL